MFNCFKKKKIDKVIMHCAATPDVGPENERWYNLDIAEIRDWHKVKGWIDVGYHYFIKRDGTIQKGRKVGNKGAHTIGQNHNIGVCYAGTKKPTDAQCESMRALMVEIRDVYGISPYDWTGHYNFANKECPGFDDKTLHTILLNDYSL